MWESAKAVLKAPLQGGSSCLIIDKMLCKVPRGRIYAFNDSVSRGFNILLLFSLPGIPSLSESVVCGGNTW